MNRRGFLAGCIAAAVAPAFVKSESLMGLYVPKTGVVTLSDFYVPDTGLVTLGDFNEECIEFTYDYDGKIKNYNGFVITDQDGQIIASGGWDESNPAPHFAGNITIS